MAELAEARRGEDRACDLPRGAARLGARPWASVDAVTPARADLVAALDVTEWRLAGGSLVRVRARVRVRVRVRVGNAYRLQ